MSNSIKDINKVIAELSAHFGKKGMDAKALTDVLKSSGALRADQSIEKIFEVETLTNFKFGILTTAQGKEYYALPCELSEDEDVFVDEFSRNAMQRQIDANELELNDLDMSYFDTGILKKWNFDEGRWEAAEEGYSVTSKQDFIFMPKNDFFAEFGDALNRHKETSPEGPKEGYTYE